MGVLKSQFGFISCAIYVAIAVLALIHDLTRKPSVFIFFDEMLLLVALPGFIVVAIPLELIGVDIRSDNNKTLLLIASAVVTAIIVYLIGAGVEALYRILSR